jgi:hypothetical protein
MREINYDDLLCNSKLKITLDQKVYEVFQPSLQQIIDYELRVKELKEAVDSGITPEEAGVLWIEVIRSIFDCIPVEILKKKTMPVIRKIAADCTLFMQESLSADAPEPANKQPDKGKKKAE